MKKLLVGAGAIAAVAFAIKKVIELDQKDKDEYIYEFESTDEMEMDENVPYDDLDEVDEEELRKMFDESSHDSYNYVDDFINGIKGFFASLPKVSIEINVDSKNSKKD